MFGLSKLWGYVAAAGTAIAAVLFAFLGAKRIGKNEAALERAQKELDNAKKAHEVESTVATTSDAQRREQLRKYERD